MIPQKKTKIVCTIGPATETEEIISKLLKAGMNVMRLNFSHGNSSEHAARIKNLEAASLKTGIIAATLQDLGGPKIRIGDFSTESIILKEGSEFIITTDEIEGNEKRVSVNYSNFAKEVEKGHIIYLHDGKKKLEVLEINGNDVVCKVLVGGEIKGRRGVNLPDSNLSISSLTEKDTKDLEFGIKHKIDFIALSFVRHGRDIVELKEILKKAKSNAKIIAKIETPQAIKNIDEIIKLSDGVMVARGDLAIEMPAEQVPALQKMIIKKCNEAGKPVITATQMLESMIKSPVPTRAEVSDIANAIIDGTDAVMLSEETTLGKYPVESVKVMSRVAISIEGTITNQHLLRRVLHAPLQDISESVTASVVKTADRVNAKYIVCLTQSGNSARFVSRFKPSQPILVFTPNESTFKQSILSSGTYPILVEKFDHVGKAVEVIRQFLKKKKMVLPGDKIILTCGSPFGESANTNMMLAETI
jgi:pyruvate kinase